MLRKVQNEMFTFELDSDAALIGSTLPVDSDPRWFVHKSAFQLPSGNCDLTVLSDHLAHFSIWGHILRYTQYIMSYTMLPYTTWTPYENQGNRISQDILSISRHIRHNTSGRGQNISQYILRYTLHTEIYFWLILYVEIYDYTCNSVYVHTSHYEILRESIYSYVLSTCLDILSSFTADILSWMSGHILVHTLTSEHIQCATGFFLPAPSRPACTLLARLHPAGAQRIRCRAFVAATRHTWSRTNKCIIMSAATGLAKSGLLVGSSRAIGSTGSASKRLRARQLRCSGDKFALECCCQR